MSDQALDLGSLLQMATNADQEGAIQPQGGPTPQPTIPPPQAAPQMAIGQVGPTPVGGADEDQQQGLSTIQELLQQARQTPEQLKQQAELERMLREELLKTPEIRANEKYKEKLKELFNIDPNKPLSGWDRFRVAAQEFADKSAANKLDLSGKRLSDKPYVSLHDQALQEALAEYKEVAPQATRIEAQLSAERKAQLNAALAADAKQKLLDERTRHNKENEFNNEEKRLIDQGKLEEVIKHREQVTGPLTAAQIDNLKDQVNKRGLSKSLEDAYDKAKLMGLDPSDPGFLDAVKKLQDEDEARKKLGKYPPQSTQDTIRIIPQMIYDSLGNPQLLGAKKSGEIVRLNTPKGVEDLGSPEVTAAYQPRIIGNAKAASDLNNMQTATGREYAEIQTLMSHPDVVGNPGSALSPTLRSLFHIENDDQSKLYIQNKLNVINQLKAALPNQRFNQREIDLINNVKPSMLNSPKGMLHMNMTLLGAMLEGTLRTKYNLPADFSTEKVTDAIEKKWLESNGQYKMPSIENMTKAALALQYQKDHS